MSKINDSFVDVKISSNGCTAYLSIQPDPACPDLSPMDLLELLKEHGVVYGMDSEVLLVLSGRYRSGVAVTNVLVAEGVEPFPGVEAKVDYKFDFSTKPKETESGQTDYREISRFLDVDEGQVLAVKRKMKPPVEGKLVTGERKVFEAIPDIAVKVRDNVIKEETENEIVYKAACPGALTFENGVLSVLPTLQISDDVDFNVGNIHYNGDVKVGRDVLPDFVVEAHGHIAIWGSAIACRLVAEGDVTVRAGIVGKNKGTVQSGGIITATFVENATLEADGDVTIKNGIIGSRVVCDGRLKVEAARSRIVGSSIKAARGITAYNLGSRFDTGTTLITGIHPDKEQDYFKIKKNLDGKWNEAKELEKRYGRSTLDGQTAPRTVSDALKQDMKKYELLKSQIQTVLQHLKKTEEQMYDHSVVIEVKETLFPRVELRIGKHKLTVSKEFYKVKVHYSEEDGRIVIA